MVQIQYLFLLFPPLNNNNNLETHEGPFSQDVYPATNNVMIVCKDFFFEKKSRPANRTGRRDRHRFNKRIGQRDLQRYVDTVQGQGCIGNVSESGYQEGLRWNPRDSRARQGLFN